MNFRSEFQTKLFDVVQHWISWKVLPLSMTSTSKEDSCSANFIFPAIRCGKYSLICGILLLCVALSDHTVFARCVESAECDANSDASQAAIETIASDATTASVPTNPASDFEYKKWKSGIMITRTKVQEGDVNIPPQINGRPVIRIGDNAFQYCQNLTSVTIPDSVTEIGNSAFVDCDGLTKVEIPHSVVTLGDHAFALCDRLTTVTIPSSVTEIEGNTFANCEHLTTAIIPNSVTKIEDSAFDNCNVITIRTPAKSFAEKYSQKLGIDYANSD